MKKIFALFLALTCSVAFGQTYKVQDLNILGNVTATTPIAIGAGGTGATGFIQSGTGAVSRTWTAKNRDSVSVYDFGAKCDGTTDDSANFQAAANAISTAGGGTVNVTGGQCYLGSTVVIPDNVSLSGPLKSVGGQPTSGQNFNLVAGTIYLNSAATLELHNSTSVSGLQIMASNLRGALPFANATAAQNGVNAYAGVGLTLKGSDVSLQRLIILGFATAIKSNDGVNNYYRQKFEWIDIDSTNGIDIYKSADIGRISHVHAWDFLTFNVGIGAYSLRSGTAFKVASNFDEGKFFDNFAFGYQIGFDIQALIDITLLDCGVDSWAANPSNPGQVGIHVGGTATQVKIIGGAYSAMDKAVSSDSVGSLFITGGAQFFGNKTHIYATTGAIRIIGNGFNYLNAGWSGTTAIQLVATSAPPLISGNAFDSITYAYVLPTGAGSATESATIWGNTFSNGASDPFIGERLVTNSTSGVSSKTFTAYSAGSLGQVINLRMSRGTIASPTVVNGNDVAGQISGSVWNGSAWSFIGQIKYQATGTPGSASTPGNIVFSTTPTGSTSLVDNVILNGTYLYPAVDNTTALGGGPSFRWSNLYTVDANVSTIEASGQITSSIATGTAPFVITSTTNIPNLNASSLNGATFASPGSIGSSVASTGAFTTLSSNGATLADNGTFSTGRYGSSGAVIVRSSAGTQVSPTVISGASNIATMIARGYDGSAYRDIGAIQFNSDGAISSSSSPGYAAIYTTPSGAVVAVERTRITSSGDVLIGTTTDDGVNKLQVTGGAKVTGTFNATTAVQVNGTALLPTLTGTTGSIGGGALGAGACTSGTVAVTSSTTAMSVVATPVTYPGDGIVWNGYVSAAGTVTVKVCAITALTPVSSIYNIRVVQ